MQRKISGAAEDSRKKERHIVTWSQEEDDILREQINIHGTDNWTIIASKFKDKTTRQCRRRWYTYLNSDFKKGGWSPEEDLLLCEAQKIFGNRWTEIAKVVSGRTDNAVKNRFSTLCKKRAKYEALAKENNSSFMNHNNKRIIIHDTLNVDVANVKKIRRSHIPDVAESCNFGSRSVRQHGITQNWQQLRTPFTVLVQNIQNNLSTGQQLISNKMEVTDDGLSSKVRGTFLRKDDPKVTALMQQAELLSSLAFQVNAESTDQSFENAWKVLQDFLNQKKEGDMSSYKISETYIQQDLRELMEDLVKNDMESQACWRQPDLQEDSSSSSEYSTGSTVLPHLENGQNKKTRAGEDMKHEYIVTEVSSNQSKEGSGSEKCGIFSGAVPEVLQSHDDPVNVEELISASQHTEFGSPLQVTPLFRSFGAGIPSPKFSESERNFLMRTLGMESPIPSFSINPSNPPPCKRALLHSL